MLDIRNHSTVIFQSYGRGLTLGTIIINAMGNVPRLVWTHVFNDSEVDYSLSELSERLTNPRIHPLFDNAQILVAFEMALLDYEGPNEELKESINAYFNEFEEEDKESREMRMLILDVFPNAKKVVKHPNQGYDATLVTIIISLNDVEGWTREDIADWLETLDLDLNAVHHNV